MKLVGLLFTALAFFTLCDAKVYLSCELAKEFSKNNMDRTLIPHWICLVNAESQGNTSKVVDQPNHTTNYGIFQINSKDWCGKDKKGGNCNIKCSDLLNDDIKDDIKCAKEILNREGFKNWKGWQNKCYTNNTTDKNKALPNLTNCAYK